MTVDMEKLVKAFKDAAISYVGEKHPGIKDDEIKEFLGEYYEFYLVPPKSASHLIAFEIINRIIKESSTDEELESKLRSLIDSSRKTKEDK